MKKRKTYLKVLLISIILIFLFTIILSILQSLNVLYGKSSEIIMFIYMAMLFFIIGFKVGKKATHKGYLEGLKIGLSLLFILIIINLLFYQNGFSLERTIYYIILILASTMGSMVGISKTN